MVQAGNISKSYASTRGAAVVALSGVSLCVESGEFVVCVGPSGCGKSTLLNLLAGFVGSDAGRVLHDNVTPVPEHGNVAVLFQADTLFPWYTVAGNIRFAMEHRAGWTDGDRSSSEARINSLLARVGLSDWQHCFPHALSGGMRQRAALARALAQSPRLLLLDEPFRSLDLPLRRSMHRLLLDVWREEMCTIFMVTHDTEEAVLLGQRVLIMSRRPGRIVEEVTVPFPHPREAALISDPAFANIRLSIERRLIAES
jgi:NitT/TauT family transport system ATP-binding protein